MLIRSWNVYHGRSHPAGRRGHLARRDRAGRGRRARRALPPGAAALVAAAARGLERHARVPGADEAGAARRSGRARSSPRPTTASSARPSPARRTRSSSRRITTAGPRLARDQRPAPASARLPGRSRRRRGSWSANIHASGDVAQRAGRPRARVARDERAPHGEPVVLAGDFNASLTLPGFSPPHGGIDDILVAGSGGHAARRLAGGAAPSEWRRALRPCTRRADRPAVTFEEARAAFPVLERLAYLNAGTNGPLARATVEAMVAQELVDLAEGRAGVDYYTRTRELRERVREKVAALIRVPAENIALTTSTTNGCNIVLAGLRLGPEDEVVTTDEEHFGLLGPLHTAGVQVRVAATAVPFGRRRPGAAAGRGRPEDAAARALAHLLGDGQRPADRRAETRDRPADPRRRRAVGRRGRGGRDAVRLLHALGAEVAVRAGLDRRLVRARAGVAAGVGADLPLAGSASSPTGAFEPRPGAARFDHGYLGATLLAASRPRSTPRPSGASSGPADGRALPRPARRSATRSSPRPGQSTLVSFRPHGDPAETVERLAERGVVVREIPTAASSASRSATGRRTTTWRGCSTASRTQAARTAPRRCRPGRGGSRSAGPRRRPRARGGPRSRHRSAPRRASRPPPASRRGSRA